MPVLSERANLDIPKKTKRLRPDPITPKRSSRNTAYYLLHPFQCWIVAVVEVHRPHRSSHPIQHCEFGWQNKIISFISLCGHGRVWAWVVNIPRAGLRFISPLGFWWNLQSTMEYVSVCRLILVSYSTLPMRIPIRTSTEGEGAE